MVRLVAFGLCAALLGFAAPTAGWAADDDADWPCPQQRTGAISAAAVWSGPDIAKTGRWDDDEEAAVLARKLASRRTPLDEMDGLIDAFAAKAGADKDDRLTHVFAGVLEIVNSERDRVMAGVARYARGQKRLADKIRAEADKIGDEQENKDLSPAQTLDLAKTDLKWDRRIFDERAHALSYVCETPTLLERRVFEIARKIQERL